MAKRKAEELGEDVKGDKQPDKKAKTEKKAYWVITIEEGSVSPDETCKSEVTVFGKKLFTTERDAFVAAITACLDDVSPKKRREIGIQDKWETRETDEGLKEMLDVLNNRNDQRDEDDGDNVVEWKCYKIHECTE